MCISLYIYIYTHTYCTGIHDYVCVYMYTHAFLLSIYSKFQVQSRTLKEVSRLTMHSGHSSDLGPWLTSLNEFMVHTPYWEYAMIWYMTKEI